MGVQEKMRDRMEKIVVLPFSMGCVSQASVAVAEQRPKRPKHDLHSPATYGKCSNFRKQPLVHGNREDGEDEEGLSGEATKHSSRFLALPRPNLSTGVNKIVKGFRSLSQLFIYEDEMEELGMEIGSPTDVKHVTHIGWDNLAKTNPFIDWDDDDADSTPALITHPISGSATLKQFELAVVPENDPNSVHQLIL